MTAADTDASSQVKTLADRSEVAVSDTWDLSSLFESNEQWEAAFNELEARLGEIEEFDGKLAESASSLAACLRLDSELDRQAERLAYYAMLRTSEDVGDSGSQAMYARFQSIASKLAQASSFIRPEIMSIDADKMNAMLQDEELSLFQLQLERMLKYRPHTLSQEGEQILAMQSEMASAARKTFEQLHNVDMKFGAVENENGEQVELSNATFGQFLQSPSREVRKTAFHQYYDNYQSHENTLAATLGGSIQKDVYYAKVRNYDSALSAALFPDNMPSTVYDNLIQSVRNHLPSVYRYLDVRRRMMGIDEIHHYDTYVPIISEIECDYPWDHAVDVIMESLQPLGEEYLSALDTGLRGRWCDRYPNKGKRSGAFSAGSFDGDPYILMNYKPKVLDDVFTLTHEAGHSMHSYYSSSNQPYEYYNYTIFVAEVASTFNEQLLGHHLMQNATDDRERMYLINKEIDSIRGTIIRQTMFAEFEKITHEMIESGEPLTTDSFKAVYKELLQAYFGDNFSIDDQLELECFRIPHFYRAFYVYKYATGLSAAIALSDRVLNGGEQELTDYLGFLKGGCSKDSLDLLRGAGVDMESPDAVNTALARFETLVDQLDEMSKNNG